MAVNFFWKAWGCMIAYESRNVAQIFTSGVLSGFRKCEDIKVRLKPYLKTI